MKKRIALILCLVMMLSVCLCGCSSEKDALIGSWTGKMDVAEAINAGVVEGLAGSDAELAEYLTIEHLYITMTMTFNEDDTYAVTVDEAALNEAIDGMMDEIMDGMVLYFEDILAAEGVEMTVEELLALSGMSLDDLSAEMRASFDSQEMVAELSSEGNFKVADGKLFLSDGLDYAVDLEVYDLYTIEGSTLTIDKGSESESDEFDDMLYPMVFTKN